MKVINQKGAAHLIAVLAIVLLVVVGFAGFRVMNANKDDNNTTASNQVPSKIQSKSDIEQASTVLDNDGSDNSMDPSQLDSDLNDLL